MDSKESYHLSEKPQTSLTTPISRRKVQWVPKVSSVKEEEDEDTKVDEVPLMSSTPLHFATFINPMFEPTTSISTADLNVFYF